MPIVKPRSSCFHTGVTSPTSPHAYIPHHYNSGGCSGHSSLRKKQPRNSATWFHQHTPCAPLFCTYGAKSAILCKIKSHIPAKTRRSNHNFIYNILLLLHKYILARAMLILRHALRNRLCYLMAKFAQFVKKWHSLLQLFNLVLYISSVRLVWQLLTIERQPHKGLVNHRSGQQPLLLNGAPSFPSS